MTIHPNLCKHFGTCGGCDSQGTSYQEQLKNKEERVRELFSQFTIKEFRDIIPSPEIFYYRNKMEYAVGSDAGNILMGLRQKKRFHRIVDLEECRIFMEGAEEVFGVFKAWIKEYGIEPYQSRRHTGNIRYAAMRHSKHYGELMVTVVLASNDDNIGALVDGLKGIDTVKSVYLCINDKLSDISITDDLKLLYGEAHIREKINGIDYLISPASFFQTNPYCCSALYGAIRQEAKDIGGRALDMCCGSGGITLQVAGDFEKVTGVDISAKNTEDASRNASINRIENTEFICGDAERFILNSIVSGKMKEYSTVILDPPRAGLSKKTRPALAMSGVENIIYVSCNPANLAEDLKGLSDSYDIEKLIPVDMFPHTRHIEVIAILKSNRV